MIRLIILIALFLLHFPGPSALAQVKLPSDFQQQLDRHELHFYQPLERSFRRIRQVKNPVQSCQFAMRSRKGGLEIRYLIRPINANHPPIPHIEYLAMASHLASNEEESHIAVHQLAETEVQEQLHADWGAVSYFRPKSAFSNKRHCKMLSFFAEGKAQVFVFFLFNQPIEALEQQLFSISFK
ncbi:MAG: hypothetical protein AAFP19_13605 [Bacteroidota bacterium]